MMDCLFRFRIPLPRGTFRKTLGDPQQCGPEILLSLGNFERRARLSVKRERNPVMLHTALQVVEGRSENAQAELMPQIVGHSCLIPCISKLAEKPQGHEAGVDRRLDVL